MRNITLYAIALLCLFACKKKDEVTSCFTASRTSVELGEEILFTDCSEHATSYEWDFGDKAAADVYSFHSKDTESTEAEPTYTYDRPGTYSVSLTTKGTESPEITATQSITVATISQSDIVGTWRLTRRIGYDSFYNEESNSVRDQVWIFSSDNTVLEDTALFRNDWDWTMGSNAKFTLSNDSSGYTTDYYVVKFFNDEMILRDVESSAKLWFDDYHFTKLD